MAAPIVILAPGVHRIPTMGDYVNSFAFVDADGSVTLVDCGLRRAPARIVAGLAGIGKTPADVTRIILTHAHGDHAGGGRELVERCGVDGAQIHADDVPYIRAGRNAPSADTTMGRLMSRGGPATFDPFPISAQLVDGQILDVAGGLRVLHTPGHSPGHVSLLHEGSGVLITGDAIFNMAWGMMWPLSALCSSASQNKQSAHVLGEVEYSVAAFTHGPEIRENAREAVRGFLSRKGA